MRTSLICHNTNFLVILCGLKCYKKSPVTFVIQFFGSPVKQRYLKQLPFNKATLYKFFRHKSCVPSPGGIEEKSFAVWLYPASSISSAVSPDCAVVKIEEHTQCQCGCSKTADSCG